MSERTWTRGWRAAVLIGVSIVMGANLITPAVAHVTSSLTHLYSHLDKRYLPGAAVPAGKLIRGTYTIDGDSEAGFASDVFNYGGRLPAAPVPHFIPLGGTPPAECPGTATNPLAANGHLCVYETSTTAASGTCVFDPVAFASCNTTHRDGFGFAIYPVNPSGLFYSTGSWAVRSGIPTAAALSQASTGKSVVRG